MIQAVTEQLSIRVKDDSFADPKFVSMPSVRTHMASWVETTFGLEHEEGTEYLKRATPKTDQAGRKAALRKQIGAGRDMPARNASNAGSCMGTSAIRTPSAEIALSLSVFTNSSVREMQCMPPSAKGKIDG